MTAIAVPSTSRATDTIGTDARPSLWKGGLAAGAKAALAVAAVAGAAMAAGVDFEIDGEAIPLPGFAVLTLVCTGVGILLASGLRRRSAAPSTRFVQVAVALTALSFVPDLTAATDTGSKLVLMATHVVAAAIVIPAIAQRLPERRSA